MIIGTNFTAAAMVEFNGATVTGFVLKSATKVKAKVPTEATTGPVSVTTAAGSATSATNFTVPSGSLPTITSFTPTSGPAGTLLDQRNPFTASEPLFLSCPARGAPAWLIPSVRFAQIRSGNTALRLAVSLGGTDNRWAEFRVAKGDLASRIIEHLDELEGAS